MNFLWENNWIFKVPDSSNSPLEYFKYYRFASVNWNAIWQLKLSILGLVFFGLLHVPINVPSFAQSTKQKVDMGKEIKIHGVSNMLAAAICPIPNYFVYSTSVLFFRAGGRSWTSGLLLALLTALLLFFGFSLLNYIPKVLIGSLVVFIGGDLLYFSIFESFYLASIAEYLGIAVITGTITLIGFSEGLLFGLFYSGFLVLFYFSSNSKLHFEKTSLHLHSANETILLRSFIEDRVRIIQADSVLFFGNIGRFYEQVVDLLSHDIKYLVVDYSNLQYMELSATDKLRQIPLNSALVSVATFAVGDWRKFSRFKRNRGLLGREAASLDEALAEILKEQSKECLECCEWTTENVFWKSISGYTQGPFKAYKNEQIMTESLIFILSGTLKIENEQLTLHQHASSIAGAEAFYSGMRYEARCEADAIYHTIDWQSFTLISKHSPEIFIELTRLIATFQKCSQIMKQQ